MEDLKDIIQESLEYYLEQERILISRLSLLPKGRFKKKKINDNTYFYLQYRKGNKVIDEYIGKDIPKLLEENIQKRKDLEEELKRVREALALINSKKVSGIDKGSNISQILEKFTSYNLWDSGIEIIGSWCFLIYQKYLPMDRYPLRTQDLDILVPFPYKGKVFDLSSVFRELGFEERFNPDGSIFFSSGSFKVEIIAPKKSSKRSEPVQIKQLSVNPQFIYFVNMLLDDSITIRISKGVKVKLPSPSSFFLHKLIVSTIPLRKKKKKKDLQQAIHVGKFILRDRDEKKKLKLKWKSISKSWKKKIQKAILSAYEFIPLEKSAIEQLEKMFK